MVYIFNNTHFISSGIRNNVPPLLQIIMWELIKQMPVDKDYLQVFSLSEKDGRQRIKHTQEVPEYNIVNFGAPKPPNQTKSRKPL